MINATIPKPPPLSALTTNRKGGGRCSTERYRVWKNAAGWELKAIKCRPISGAVDIRIALEPPALTKAGRITKVKHDASNHIKAVEDLLVAHGLIEDDSYPTVRSVAAEWSEHVKGCVVSVFPVAMSAPAILAAE